MKQTIEKIIKELNRKMEVNGSKEVRKEVSNCYREVLTKHLINN